MKDKELQLNRENLIMVLKQIKNKNNSNKEKENKIMMNRTNAKEMRMETLKANGINTENFFNLSLTIPVGHEVKIVVDGKEMVVPANTFTNATPVTNYGCNNFTLGGREVNIIKGDLVDVETGEILLVGEKDDPIIQAILEEGYVNNTKLFRRWITAQTFKMLNYKSYRNPNRNGWEACMKDCFNYNYQFTMLLEEIRVLSILQKEDYELFKERTHFFNGDVVVATLNDYLFRLEKYVKNQRKEKPRKYRNKEYVKLARYGNVFVSELEERVYNKIKTAISRVERECDYGNYRNIYLELKEFMEKSYNKLPYETPKSQAWKDAFKASGAYYTLQNLIRFHEVLIKNCDDKYDSELHLTELLDVFKGEEWRFHNLLVKTIEYNNFDLRKSIVEGHNAPNTSVERRYGSVNK